MPLHPSMRPVEPVREWLFRRAAGRTTYMMDNGEIRHEWDSPRHKQIYERLADLEQLATSTRTLTAAEVSDAIRLFARTLTALARISIDPPPSEVP